MLEELTDLRALKEDFKYEPHTVDIRHNESRTILPFLKLNPNGKIPVLVDPHGKGGRTTLFESGAILLYLAEKYDELLPKEQGPARYDVIKWLFWGSTGNYAYFISSKHQLLKLLFVLTGVSSHFKRFGFYYHYCPHNLPYCIARYTRECKRLLQVLENQLSSHGKHFIVGELYSIADIAGR